MSRENTERRMKKGKGKRESLGKGLGKDGREKALRRRGKGVQYEGPSLAGTLVDGEEIKW